jgi:hypothetical protein
MRSHLTLVVSALAALLLPLEALACQLLCVKEASAVDIRQYPATVHYTVTFSSPMLTCGDYVDQLQDSLLPAETWLGMERFLVYGADSRTVGYDLTVQSYEACRALAGNPAPAADGSVTLTNEVSAHNQYQDLTTTCTRQVLCWPPGGGATRTPGWWKNRVDALAACVATGVDLGFTQVTTVEQALGFLWANEGRYDGLAKARLKLGKHLLVATCNVRLLGGVPGEFTLAGAATLAEGTSCTSMVTLASTIDGFNNLFDEVVFPEGFDPGPAYGAEAKKMAVMPVIANGTCTP